MIKIFLTPTSILVVFLRCCCRDVYLWKNYLCEGNILLLIEQSYWEISFFYIKENKTYTLFIFSGRKTVLTHQEK